MSEKKTVKVEKISKEIFEQEKAKPRRGKQGSWGNIIAEIKKDGEPRKISGITRGAIAAGARAAKDANLAYVADYKELFLIIGIGQPEAPKEDKKAKK